MRSLLLAPLVVLAACHAPPPAPPSNDAALVPFAGHGEVTPEEIAAHWMDGEWPVSELVDPRRGLVRYWTETGEVDDAAPDIQAHLCGRALADALPSLDAGLPAIARASRADHGFGCDDSECELTIAGEYEPIRRALFDVRPGAPTTLIAYVEMEAFTPDADARQVEIHDWAVDEATRACP